MQTIHALCDATSSSLSPTRVARTVAVDGGGACFFYTGGGGMFEEIHDRVKGITWLATEIVRSARIRIGAAFHALELRGRRFVRE
jgi:PHP family Zn ribbon phosphoesterase